MKKVFIYYSLSGNGDAVADFLKKKKVEIRKIITKEPLPKNRVLQILSGGYKAMINYCDKLEDFDNNINNYDEIIIGSPIWNSRLSSPINSVLKELDLHNKKVTFILYSGSGKPNKASQILNEKYKCNIINLKSPKDNKEELQKIIE
jgi:flavodoxin